MIQMGTGSFATTTAFLLWIPLVLILFSTLPARRAITVAVLAGWMFLPMANYTVTGLPDVSKLSLLCFSMFVGAAAFDFKRLMTFRPQWYDVPMAIVCLQPLLTSLLNDLGLYDGLSSVLSSTISYGIPYYLGRVYFNSLGGMRSLAIGLFFAGLAYSLFVLYESRMSPQLHHIVYGYYQHGFRQTLRFGGYRPMVFMQHGLMVGMFMGSCMMCALLLWRGKTIKKVFGLPMAFLALYLVFTFMMQRSLGAYMLFAAGTATLFVHRWIRINWLIVGFSIFIVVYVSCRITNVWNAEQIVDLIAEFSHERSRSLASRIDQEIMLAERAREQPFFGWGGWNRMRIFSETGEDLSVTDSMWIVMFGQRGIVGLLAMTSVILLPAVLLQFRIPPRLWTHPRVAPTTAFAVILVLYMMDNLFNGMYMPWYMIAAGGLMGLRLGKA